MNRAICSSIVFQIKNNKSPSHLMNRYKLGKTVQDTLYITPFECLYLFFKNKIQAENTYFSNLPNLMHELLKDEGDIELYSMYESLKSKGFFVKREGDSLFYRRTAKSKFSGPIKVRRENSFASLEELLESSPSIYTTLDDEGDITVFEVNEIDPKGERETERPSNPELVMIDGRFFSEGMNLPEWLGEDFKGIKLLSDSEVKWINGEVKKTDLHQMVYDDLVRRGLIVKTGFKYGSNFRAYKKSMEEHAEYLVYVLGGSEEWYKISRAVRVAQGVRKLMVFAGLVEGNIRYVCVSRLRDLFFMSSKSIKKQDDLENTE